MLHGTTFEISDVLYFRESRKFIKFKGYPEK